MAFKNRNDEDDGTVIKLRSVERLAWVLGILLVAAYASAWIHGSIGSRQSLQAFDEARTAARPVDTSLWDANRIKAYQATFEQAERAPLAVLRIPGIDLEVPVLDGTDEFALNRGVGRIIGTARPGEPGNVGIAGHRDGFFRRLKDVSVGDAIELELLSGSQTYRITEIRIIDPDQLEVLQPTAEPSITLVTCYPFYYVGSAPQRYIVRAGLQSTTPTSQGVGRERNGAPVRNN